MADILFVPLSDNTTDASVPTPHDAPKPWWESNWIALVTFFMFALAVFCVISLLWAWGTGRINHKGDWLRWASHDARERRRLAANPPPPPYIETMDMTPPPTPRTWSGRLGHLFGSIVMVISTIPVRYNAWVDRYRMRAELHLQEVEGRRQEAEARRQQAVEAYRQQAEARYQEAEARRQEFQARRQETAEYGEAERATRIPANYNNDPHWPRHPDGRLWDFERDGDWNSIGGVVDTPGPWYTRMPERVWFGCRRRGVDAWENDGIVLGGLARQGL